MRWLSPRNLRRSWARYAFSFVAFLAVAAQLGTVAHLAFVRHVECAEHGEMVEDDSPALDHEDATASYHQDVAPSHGHDHCGIVTLRRERTQSSQAPVVAAPQPRTDLGHTLERAVAPPPAIAVLDLAPKNSPPVV